MSALENILSNGIKVHQTTGSLVSIANKKKRFLIYIPEHVFLSAKLSRPWVINQLSLWGLVLFEIRSKILWILWNMMWNMSKKIAFIIFFLSLSFYSLADNGNELLRLRNHFWEMTSNYFSFSSFPLRKIGLPIFFSYIWFWISHKVAK